MPSTTAARRSLYVSVTTAVAAGAVALSLLPFGTSASAASASTSPSASAPAATSTLAASPVGAVAAAQPLPSPAAPALGGLTPLLDEQAAAGLECTTSTRGIPLCVHGVDSDGGTGAGQGHQTVAGTASSATPTGDSGDLGCYGDGTSGARVRAVYARPQSAADGYRASLPSIRGWAAGISKQFDQSATATRGRRHVRFATTAGPSCTLAVLNVVLPDAAFGSFSATVDALEARGLDAKSSKYLVWADAAGLCGIATTYADHKPGLDNLNNSAMPSYARVDRRCWGKVETHELVHMLGGIQQSAPNSTGGYHCSDGSDVMCYDDRTAGSAQRSVCPASRINLLDCRNDDYFSTAAPRGSYLQMHWNTARSSFLSATLSESAPTAGSGSQPAAPSSSPSPSAPQPSSPSPSPSPSPAAEKLLPTLPALPVPSIVPTTIPTLLPTP